MHPFPRRARGDPIVPERVSTLEHTREDFASAKLYHLTGRGLEPSHSYPHRAKGRCGEWTPLLFGPSAPVPFSPERINGELCDAKSSLARRQLRKTKGFVRMMLSIIPSFGLRQPALARTVGRRAPRTAGNIRVFTLKHIRAGFARRTNCTILPPPDSPDVQSGNRRRPPPHSCKPRAKCDNAAISKPHTHCWRASSGTRRLSGPEEM